MRLVMPTGLPVVTKIEEVVESQTLVVCGESAHRISACAVNVPNKKYPSTESLRLAQLQVMADANYRNPYYWAGFTVIGGYAPY
jgi:hypothetical protein